MGAPAFVVGLILGGLVGWLIACQVDLSWELSAIEANVGEYYLDADHNKQFRWKQQKEGEE